MTNSNNFTGISFGNNSNKIFKYREKNICPRWNVDYRQYKTCDIKIEHNSRGSYNLTVTMKGKLAFLGFNAVIKYWAANPPTYLNSYSGSGLPYNNEFIAFENTINKGQVRASGNVFNIHLHYPNSYYANLGKTFVRPEVLFKICDQNDVDMTPTYKVPLGHGIPFRTESFPIQRNWLNGPLFYFNKNLPVRNQEDILRDNSYPTRNYVPKNFWGLTPPH